MRFSRNLRSRRPGLVLCSNIIHCDDDAGEVTEFIFPGRAMFKEMKDLLACLRGNRLCRLNDRRVDVAASAELVDPVFISVKTDDRPGNILLRKYLTHSLRLVHICADESMNVRVCGKDIPHSLFHLFHVLPAHVFIDLADHIRVSEHRIPE